MLQTYPDQLGVRLVVQMAVMMTAQTLIREQILKIRETMEKIDLSGP